MLRVVDVHPVQLRGEQSRLVAAGTSPDFHNNVLVIVGILGQEQNLQLIFQLLNPLSGIGQFLLRQLPHLLVRLLLQDGKTVLHILLRFFVRGIGLHQRSQIGLFLHQFAEPALILRH